MGKIFKAPWDKKDITLIVLLTISLAVLTFVLFNYTPIGSYINTIPENNSLLTLTLFTVQWGIMLIPLLLVTLFRHKLKAKYFAFKHIGVLRTIGLIVSGWLVFFAVSIIVGVIIFYLGIEIPGYQAQENILPIFGNDNFSLAIAGITIVILGPIVEEIFFRGFILGASVNKFGVFWGNIFTAFIFGLSHFQINSIIPLFILGVIVNSIAIRGRSIIPAIGFHILNNGIFFVVQVIIMKDIINLEQLTA